VNLMPLTTFGDRVSGQKFTFGQLGTAAFESTGGIRDCVAAGAALHRVPRFTAHRDVYRLFGAAGIYADTVKVTRRGVPGKDTM
jgi:hypothetical protein